MVRKKENDYGLLLSGVTQLLKNARTQAARSVNSIITMTYWELGRRIVEYEQKGEFRAEYGKSVLRKLSEDLTKIFGRGFSERNLEQMRLFYTTYPISQTLSAKFNLPWSHYIELLSLKNKNARRFYEEEALHGGWTVRQLRRQIATQFYERTLLSKNKKAMLIKGGKAKPEDRVTPEEEIKDPYVLEFLNLKDEYSESDFEEALICHLESFLLELGGDFAFIGRQKRLRVGDEWYRIDLVFFHRKLRCLVLIDLKMGKFTHGDAGQMNLYCNYAAQHWTKDDENPPVGLILCTGKNEAVARYALGGLSNKILTAKYQTLLPEEKVLENEIQKTQAKLRGKNKK